MFICKRISRTVSTIRTDPLHKWGSPDALHHINFYWLQQKLRTSGPCAISPYCSIHMVCFLCLYCGVFLFVLFFKKSCWKSSLCFDALKKTMELCFKKNTTEVCEFKIFLLSSSSSTISNINLWAEDLKTLKLKSKAYL